MPLKKGPNPKTIADGYSFNDERFPVSGPDFDFDYKEEEEDDEVLFGSRSNPYGLDHHLANPENPKLLQSHQGEHRGDFGSVEVNVTKYTKLMAFCAALNSCSLGYDIGVNTCAGPLVKDYMGLSNIQLEIFFGSLNLFAMVGAIGAHSISDRHGRRWSFIAAAVFFICGCAVLVAAQSFTALMVGRTFIGLGVGFGLAVRLYRKSNILIAYKTSQYNTSHSFASILPD